ncbi:hypothetical protein B0H19DRAFT_1133863 [Mycena capillaripes]|nr:hypothetical protein B0H19DRAFT_1133863 [Mycena capillaripes]
MSDTVGADTPAPSFLPGPPFDNPNTDVILSSSDGVTFRVHSLVLSLLSPVFETMFRLPQPHGEASSEPISMAESALVLDRMLKFCYPGAQPVVESIHQLREILEISLVKYDIQSIIPTAKQYLQKYIESDPVAVFAIACRHEWKDLATDAARMSLKLPLRSFTESIPELAYVAASHYHSLLKYHASSGTACARVTQNLRWIQAPPAQVWWTCTNSSCPHDRLVSWYLSDGEPWPVRDWFLAYMKACRKALKVRPLTMLDDARLMVDAVKGLANCFICREKGFAELQLFAADTFRPKILSAINDVQLDLGF